MIPLLGPDEPSQDHSRLRTSPSESHKPDDAPISWAYFHFPASKLALLKATASKTPGDDPLVPWISTNDALAAFIWQRISAVRLTRRKKPDDTTTFQRAVNIRRCFKPPLPEAYMGHMVAGTFNSLTFAQIASSDLAALAFMIRRALNEVDEYTVRSIVTLIDQERDRTTISFAANLDLDRDLMFSSWADLRLYGADFGPLLGRPQLVRRQRFVPLESLIYLMPRTEAGDIDAAICLKDVDLDALRKDTEWTAYAEYIG